MSAWTRMAGWLGFGQQRAAQLDPLLAALNQRYGGIYSSTPVSPDTAARKVAVGSSIRLVSNTARTMPVDVFTGSGSATKELQTPPVLRDPDGTGRGLPDWVAQAAWSLAARGNLMVHVLAWNGLGLPDIVEVLNPDLVYPDPDPDGTLWWKLAKGGRIPGRNIIHRRMYPVPGVVLGLSPIEQHAATIGLGISAEKFGADYFSAGGHPTGLLKSSAPLTEGQAKTVKSKFRIATESREPVLLPDGISYERIQITPNESQFLDAQGYSSAECARIFGPGMPEILGYDTGTSLTYANLVDRDLQLLKFTLDPYLVIVEEVLTTLLPKPHYAKLNRDSLLRMSPLDRYKRYEIGARIGMETPNDQLALEDKPPVPWGAVPYVVQKQAAPQDQQTGAL